MLKPNSNLSRSTLLIEQFVLLEFDKQFRDLEREHHNSPTDDTAARLARAHQQRGDLESAIDVELGHHANKIHSILPAWRTANQAYRRSRRIENRAIQRAGSGATSRLWGSRGHSSAYEQKAATDRALRSLTHRLREIANEKYGGPDALNRFFPASNYENPFEHIDLMALVHGFPRYEASAHVVHSLRARNTSLGKIASNDRERAVSRERGAALMRGLLGEHPGIELQYRESPTRGHPDWTHNNIDINFFSRDDPRRQIRHIWPPGHEPRAPEQQQAQEWLSRLPLLADTILEQE